MVRKREADAVQDDREVTLSVRLPAELHKAAKRQAEAEDRSMNQLIRVALRHYLGKKG
jgi:predicted HicB family RNase H-like nuclease